jgi:gluconolactonase
MARQTFVLGLGLCLTVSLVHAAGIVANGADVRKLADGFRFTEGPASDKDGNVYFTDIPNNRIHKWSVGGQLSTFLENSRGANGLAFDKQGSLIACAGGSGQILSISPSGDITVLAESYQGKPLNSPNDLWIDPKGGIYFSDPRYGSRDGLPQDGEHVYYLSPDRKQVTRVISDMVRPNGLIGTPGGKLYVADHGADKTFVYDINLDGTLTNKQLFVSQGSDGLTLDSQGNIYLTAEAVTVYTPAGQLIETISVPERPANVCFGGTDNKTLFITARTSLYAVEMQVKGLALAAETAEKHGM